MRIVFQKEIEADAPVCLNAKGLMAVEDSAGFGYADGIAAILSAGPEDEQYADCADWLGIESPKEAQDWIAGQKAFPAEISDDLQFIDEQFRSRPAPKSRKRRKGLR